MSPPREPDDDARRDSFRVYVEPEVEVLLRVARSMAANDADAEDEPPRRSSGHCRPVSTT